MPILTTLEQQTLDVLARHFPRYAGPLTLETRLREDLGADSLDFVELLFDLEETYGVQIPESDAAGLRTVEDVVRYVDAHRP